MTSADATAALEALRTRELAGCREAPTDAVIDLAIAVCALAAGVTRVAPMADGGIGLDIGAAHVAIENDGGVAVRRPAAGGYEYLDVPANALSIAGALEAM